VAANDGAKALDLVKTERPDVVVLDVMMPAVDGLTVCRVLRAERNRVPVLMLTARTETSDRVAGLDAGADSESGTITPQHHGNRADHVAEITAKLNTALQPLVDAGTITAADRTAIITAFTTRPTTRPAEGAPRGPQAKLSALVSAGTITQAKADAVAAALRAARPAEGTGSDDHDHSTHQRGPRAEGLAKAAEVIGISVADLKTALKSGQTIAQVAQANGVSVNSVIDAMVADATATLRQRITDLVNGVRPTQPTAPTGN